MANKPTYVLAETLDWRTMQKSGPMCFKLKDIKWIRQCEGYVDIKIDNSCFAFDMSGEQFMILVDLLDNMKD